MRDFDHNGLLLAEYQGFGIIRNLGTNHLSKKGEPTKKKSDYRLPKLRS